MPKIWFDDNRKPPDDSWIWAQTSYDCFVIFSRHIVNPIGAQIEEISFDHDLGGEDKSIAVANYLEHLAKHNAHPRVKWSIHTENPNGREQLLMTLQRCDEFWDKAN
jgi:hypothetical protein